MANKVPCVEYINVLISALNSGKYPEKRQQILKAVNEELDKVIDYLTKKINSYGR